MAMSEAESDNVDTVVIMYWQPEEVKSYLANGGANYVGVVDDTTVLKYPHIKGELEHLRMEAARYTALGPYQHLVAFKGLSKDGIRLERVTYRLRDYLVHATTTQKDQICLQAIRTVQFFHSKRYFHCDIKVDNMLVDDHGNLKFCDLEGQLSCDDGTVSIHPTGQESGKSRWPGPDCEEHSVTTELFALGTAMYHILHGHEPFPDLDAFHDEDEVQHRFKHRQFPELPQTGLGKAIRKCWSGGYTKAEEVLEDVKQSTSRFGWCAVM